MDIVIRDVSKRIAVSTKRRCIIRSPTKVYSSESNQRFSLVVTGCSIDDCAYKDFECSMIVEISSSKTNKTFEIKTPTYGVSNCTDSDDIAKEILEAKEWIHNQLHV